MKRTTMLVAAICAVSAQAQEANTTVTLTTKAAPLQSILVQASRHSGLALDAGLLKDWPVIVRVKNMPRKQFLDQLAKVLDAEWTKSGETFVLSRPAARIRLAEGIEAEQRLPWVQAEVAKFLKENAIGQDWSDNAIDKRLKEDAERRRKIADQMRNQGETGGGEMRISFVDSNAISPASLVLNEAVRKLNPRHLAAIVPGQRVVFSNVPTRMQRPLGYAPATIEPFVRAYDRILAANQSIADANSPTMQIESPLTKKGDPIQGIMKLLAIAQRFGNGLQLTMKVVGRQGQVLDTASAYFAPPNPEPGVAPADATGDINLSETSKAMIRALQSDSDSAERVVFGINLGDNLSGSMGNEAAAKPIPKEVAPIFADPIANEPMSFFISEILLGLAESRKKDLIAYVPDIAFTLAARRLSGGKITVADLYKSAPAMGLGIEEGDALLVSPGLRAQADRSRVNRTEFGRLIGSIGKQGYPGLEELARYSLAMPTWNEDNLDAKWLSVYSPTAHNRYASGPTVYYRLYGSLTQAQKLPTARRVMLLANQMSAQQRTFLEEVVYQAEGGPMIVGRGTMIMATATMGQRGGPQESPEPEIIQQEPTEAFPNGLPPNTRLELSRRWVDGVYAVDPQGNGRFLSAGDLGLRLGIDPTKLPPEMKMQTNFVSYTLADLLFVNLNVQFGRRARSGELTDAAIKPGAKALTYEQLPKPFLDDVDRARQRAANMRTMSFGPGRSTPPPSMR